MQGIILLGFRKFIRESFGDALWREAQCSAGNGGRIYLPLTNYSYPELIELVDAIAEETGTSSHKLLDDFGAFLAPDLIRMYAMLLDPRWKFVDILVNAHDVVERAAALKRDLRSAPTIQCVRHTPRHVVLTFSGKPRLCAMARGVIRGMAAHLDEPAHIREAGCMQLGQRQCEIMITLQGIGATLGHRRLTPTGNRIPTIPPGASIPGSQPPRRSSTLLPPRPPSIPAPRFTSIPPAGSRYDR